MQNERLWLSCGEDSSFSHDRSGLKIGAAEDRRSWFVRLSSEKAPRSPSKISSSGVDWSSGDDLRPWSISVPIEALDCQQGSARLKRAIILQAPSSSFVNNNASSHDTAPRPPRSGRLRANTCHQLYFRVRPVNERLDWLNDISHWTG